MYQSGADIAGFPLLGSPAPSFEDELRVLRALSGEQILRWITRAHYREGQKLFSSDGTVTAVAADQLRALGRRTTAHQQTVERVLRDPEVEVGAFCDVLQRYWESVFRGAWERSRSRLDEAVAQAQVRLQRGVYALLSDLWPGVQIESDREHFSMRRSHQHDIDFTQNDARLLLMVSQFVWPHVRIHCSQPDRVVLSSAPPAMLERVAPVRPSEPLLALLEALADETRLQALRFLVTRPRSTQELASLISVGAPTLSEHLRKLENAGVVRSRREGYYVLYEVSVDLQELLRAKLAGYFVSSSDPADVLFDEDA